MANALLGIVSVAALASELASQDASISGLLGFASNDFAGTKWKNLTGTAERRFFFHLAALGLVASVG